MRLALLLYCHITEANVAHSDGQQPKVFNFLNKYRKGVPPSFNTKIAELRSLVDKLNFNGLSQIFDEIVRTDIRNAFFHPDYILYDGHLRLKHRGSESASIPFDDVTELLGKAIDFFL
jgi:hypothetical protein